MDAMWSCYERWTVLICGDFFMLLCSDCRSVMIWVWLFMMPVLVSHDMIQRGYVMIDMGPSG